MSLFNQGKNNFAEVEDTVLKANMSKLCYINIMGCNVNESFTNITAKFSTNIIT